jgi:hypothetical protein
MSALRPSQTTIQSPVSIFIFVIWKLRGKSGYRVPTESTLRKIEAVAGQTARAAGRFTSYCCRRG